MEPDEIKLKLILDELNIPIDLSTFENRLILQKISYILQDFGIDLNLHYNWYISGPYCPYLATLYYSLQQKIAAGDNDWKNYRISEEVQKILHRVKISIIDSKPKGIKLSRWLELEASILYINNNFSTDKDSIKKEIKIKKPYLFDHFNTGYESLIEAKLI